MSPGVLHAVTGSSPGTASASRRPNRRASDRTRLFFITHDAKESAVQATVHDLRELPRCAASMPSCGSSVRPSVRYVSTRGQAPELGFADALLAGLAADGGLYVPETWPALPGDDVLDACDSAWRRPQP